MSSICSLINNSPW